MDVFQKSYNVKNSNLCFVAQGFARLPTFIVNWQKIDQNYFILTTYNSIDYIIFFKKKKRIEAQHNTRKVCARRTGAAKWDTYVHDRKFFVQFSPLKNKNVDFTVVRKIWSCPFQKFLATSLGTHQKVKQLFT